MSATGVCDLCGGHGTSSNPLVDEGFSSELAVHLHCLNSDEGNAWIARRCAADPAYARFHALSTVGYRMPCAACEAQQSVSPKAYGMSAAFWEGNCTECFRSRPMLNAYRDPEGDVRIRLGHLSQEFSTGPNAIKVLAEVERLASEAEPLLGTQHCPCGGYYSLAAHPRCTRCRHVLLESPFHVTDGSIPSTPI